MIPTIETERLLLREFKQSDIDAYTAICADPEVVKFLSSGVPMNREEAWRHMAMILGHWQLRGYGLWAVEEKETGSLVGRVGLLNPEDWPGLELAWTLARAQWHRGFATEAAHAALDYAFRVVKADHIISLIHVENLASVKVAERIGERLERTIPFKSRKFSVYGIWRPRETDHSVSHG